MQTHTHTEHKHNAHPDHTHSTTPRTTKARENEWERTRVRTNTLRQRHAGTRWPGANSIRNDTMYRVYSKAVYPLCTKS